MKPPEGKEAEWNELYGPFWRPGAEAALYGVLYGDGDGWPEDAKAKLGAQLLQWWQKVHHSGR